MRLIYKGNASSAGQLGTNLQRILFFSSGFTDGLLYTEEGFIILSKNRFLFLHTALVEADFEINRCRTIIDDCAGKRHQTL